MKVIKEFEPCEHCTGRGLVEDSEGYTIQCPICQGYGENLVTVRKEALDHGEESERHEERK